MCLAKTLLLIAQKEVLPFEGRYNKDQISTARLLVKGQLMGKTTFFDNGGGSITYLDDWKQRFFHVSLSNYGTSKTLTLLDLETISYGKFAFIGKRGISFFIENKNSMQVEIFSRIDASLVCYLNPE